MNVSRVVAALESIAPSHLAADWDNVGLLIGDAGDEVRKVIFCIDLTAAVLDEAVRAKAQMVVAYHPVIFKPISRVTAGDASVAYAAARAGLAVYSPHTALDAAAGGVNDVLADVIGLKNRRPLEPSAARGQCKIVVFVPPADLSRVAEAAFASGAGRIGQYFDCAFFSHGIGAFCGAETSRPTIGAAGRHEATEELRLEVIAPRCKAAEICDAVRAAHSYEEPAIDVYPLEEYPEGCGMGRVGWLQRPSRVEALVAKIKKALGVSRVQVSPAVLPAGAGRGKRPALVLRAACCAGACGGLYRAAAAAGATLLLTGEMRHHDALAAAAAGLTVICAGHSHSERVALASYSRLLSDACKGLRVALSKADRDPFKIV